jgi:hypothetical protein
MTGAERQLLYAKARQRDMAEVAYALKDVPAAHQGQPESLRRPLPGTPSADRLRRGLAGLLADDPVAMAFFDDLISSDDGK